MNCDEIAELYELRKREQGPELERMRQIQAIMENDFVLPLPELSEDEKPAVANLASQGMAQISRRIASVEPTYYFPSVDVGNDEANQRAADRKRISMGWRHDNHMKQRLGKRARHFLAFANSPVVIKPDRKLGIPRWMVKDPLWTFPGEDAFDDYLPGDCIFVSRHSYRGLLSMFAGNEKALEEIKGICKPHGWNYENPLANGDVEFELVEYIDDQYDHLVLVGANPDEALGMSIGPASATLIKANNRANHPLVVNPGSISLSKQMGHFDGIIGMYQTQASLMAMTVVAQRRAVWPREWAVANPGEQIDVVSIPDPYKGQPGEINGGRLEQQNLDPSFRVLELMDRLEYGERQTAGLPAEFGGSSATNIRTGRRGAQVLGATIDFTIAEAQDIFATSLCEEGKIAIAIDKGYFNRKKVYHIATRSFQGSVSYKPSQVWETDKHVVDYPIAGTDLQNLPIEGGQRVAMKTLSRRAFMEIDPVVTDVDAQIQQMHREGVEDAFLTSIQTMAADPAGPYQPIHLARLDEKLAKGMELYEAITELQGEIQKEQAEQAPDSAAAQPGLSMPGQGVEQPATIPEGTASMQNLTGLLGQLGAAQTARAYRPTG